MESLISALSCTFGNVSPAAGLLLGTRARRRRTEPFFPHNFADQLIKYDKLAMLYSPWMRMMINFAQTALSPALRDLPPPSSCLRHSFILRLQNSSAILFAPLRVGLAGSDIGDSFLLGCTAFNCPRDRPMPPSLPLVLPVPVCITVAIILMRVLGIGRSF